MAQVAAVALQSFLVALSGAMVPGALFGIAVSRAFRRGVAAGTTVAAGHVAVEAVLILCLWLGLGGLLASRPVVVTVSLVGGVVLTFMGWGMVGAAARGMRPPAALTEVAPSALPQTPRGAPSDAAPDPTALDSLGPLAAGAVATVANPYWLLWWATIGARYVGLASDKGPLILAAFSVSHMAADVGWLFVVSASVAAGRSLLASRGYHILSFVLGVFVMTIGLYFIYSGVASWLR